MTPEHARQFLSAYQSRINSVRSLVSRGMPVEAAARIEGITADEYRLAKPTSRPAEYLPLPSEIESQAAAIRSRWTPEMMLNRRSSP
jgi:hypothetical protein